MNAYRTSLIKNLREMYNTRWACPDQPPSLTASEAETILRVISELEKSPMLRAQYNVVKYDETRVLVRDLDGPLSITNDAEDVVKELLVQFPHRRIFYIDTDGNCDELCHDGKKFTYFAPARDVCLP